MVEEARLLNRIIRRTDEGWEYEADQRHAELIVKGLGLEEAKAVATSAEGERPWLAEEDEEKLGSREAREFRGLSAQRRGEGVLRSASKKEPMCRATT